MHTAAALAEYGMRVAWARVEGATLQGLEDNGVMSRAHLRNDAVSNDRATHRSRPGVPRSLSLALSLFLSVSLSLSRSLARSLARSLSLSLSPRGELHGQGHHLIDPKLRPGGKSEPKTTSTHES